MLDRLTFWRLYEAMDIPARPGHDCLDHDHTYLDCPHTESIVSLREAAHELLTVLQHAASAPMPEPLYCEVCDRDASATVVIARWHDTNVCLDCLHHHGELETEGWCDEDEDEEDGAC